MAAMAMREITNQEEEDFSTCPGSPQQFLETPTSSDSEDHIIEIPMDVDIHVPNLVHQKEPEQDQPKLTDINEQKGQCRLCHDEDVISHLESPCACKGTLMYAHRRCIHRWCNMKGDITCEICRHPYVPNYTVIEPRNAVIGAPAVEIRGRWNNYNTENRSPVMVSSERGSERGTANVSQNCDVRSPARGIICGILLIVLLGGMFVRDMFDPKSASAPSNEEGSDLSPSPSTVCILMFSVAPFILISCLYEIYCFISEFVDSCVMERGGIAVAQRSE